jgi:hypothetical protein
MGKLSDANGRLDEAKGSLRSSREANYTLQPDRLGDGLEKVSAFLQQVLARMSDIGTEIVGIVECSRVSTERADEAMLDIVGAVGDDAVERNDPKVAGIVGSWSEVSGSGQRVSSAAERLSQADLRVVEILCAATTALREEVGIYEELRREVGISNGLITVAIGEITVYQNGAGLGS